jgi:hypothetical protein
MRVSSPVAGVGAVDGQDGSRADDPVVVLTYPAAGGQRLRALLEPHRELACTAASGILAACHQAATAWGEADDRPQSPPSSLAVLSIRQLAAVMITAIKARTGGSRWCEIAAVEPSAARTFLRLFPGAKFVCLHRACPDVVAALLRANPWGLSGPGFAPYVSAYPASSAAALSAWWAERAGPLLQFESEHPQACLRMRFEDLVQDADGALQRLRVFAGLTAEAAPLPSLPRLPGEGDADSAGDEVTAAAPPFPVGQLPVGLVTKINEIHHALGFPALPADPRT